METCDQYVQPKRKHNSSGKDRWRMWKITKVAHVLIHQILEKKPCLQMVIWLKYIIISGNKPMIQWKLKGKETLGLKVCMDVINKLRGISENQKLHLKASYYNNAFKSFNRQIHIFKSRNKEACSVQPSQLTRKKSDWLVQKDRIRKN